MTSDRTGLVVLDEAAAAETVRAREREGWRIFRLPPRMSSRNELFEGVRGTLPLDPPLQSNRSWDALTDSLWSGLDGLGDDRIVIVWPDAGRMERQALQDFAIATDIFRDLPTSLADPGMTAGPTKQVLVIQVR